MSTTPAGTIDAANLSEPVSNSSEVLDEQAPSFEQADVEQRLDDHPDYDEVLNSGNQPAIADFTVTEDSAVISSVDVGRSC